MQFDKATAVPAQKLGTSSLLLPRHTQALLKHACTILRMPIARVPRRIEAADARVFTGAEIVIESAAKQQNHLFCPTP